MMKRLIGIAFVLTMTAAWPALAGGECEAHASKQKAVKAASAAQHQAAAKSTGSCDDALALAERTITEIDGGVAIEFRSRDRKVLDRIVELANEGRIFGDGTPESSVPRRVKRSGKTVTLTATGKSASQVSQIRDVAASLGSANPVCGERLAEATAAAREG